MNGITKSIYKISKEPYLEIAENKACCALDHKEDEKLTSLQLQ